MRTAPRIGSGLVGWRRMTVVAALANAAVLFGYGLTRGDREALGFAVVMLVGIGLLRVGTGLLGLLVLAALFLGFVLGQQVQRAAPPPPAEETSSRSSRSV